MDTSHLSRFYKKTTEEKIQSLKEATAISEEDAALLQQGIELSDELANHMIENQIAKYTLPLGAALNFLIDEKEYVVPMVTEEPSVIAAASAGAKIIQRAGGFTTALTNRKMIGQVAIKQVPNITQATEKINKQKKEILQLANQAHPSIVKRGGGAEDIQVRRLEMTDKTQEFLVIHLIIDTQEAMGANIVNTMMEAIAPFLEELSNGIVLMSILSNYATECLATATCQIPVKLLKRGSLSGEEVRDRIIEAWQFAYADPYRAVTHNKGIMNGIDAVVLATGNDWRAIEAGSHAYASRNGQYRSLSNWGKAENGDLVGSLTLPLPLGSVGGSIGIHPAAQFSQRLMQAENAKEMEAITVSVGLAQNFSALKALVTEGIQRGHMGLQAKSLAISAGATGDQINLVARKLKKAPNMNLETAKSLLTELKENTVQE